MLSRAVVRSASKGQSPILSKFTLPKAYPAASTAQSRSTTSTSNLSNDEAQSILVAQRKLRPLSPHLSIYEPQLTSIMSISTRISGVILSTSAYAFALSYLAAPSLGMHIESQTIAEAFGSLPDAANIGIKGMVALPFSYHVWNGVRHLVWDMGKMLDIKSVYTGGYVVLALTGLSTVYLAIV
ncbi:cytochrome b560 subunit of succinate dehydrogenase [Choiromyces venosus 120613-1]|uniref:Cytochrome b560 subunit of succinate dehydrogenase n=1 Tax=Choiromyces venosus 120613-1 TaxID=1336337 RepID=A0A3N4K2F0_9PEZI|nr:cytochrome b560 subunit of succinate dehydrogenase [Choiromyces venosus 120613-1]